jgi:adenosylcobyric acid synthase
VLHVTEGSPGGEGIFQPSACRIEKGLRGGLLIAGTSSDVGKSVIVAGLCRWLHRSGVAVAPFKAQNMSLNAAVTADGGEIGRAQAAQAAAAGIPAEVAMNPVLIKPTGPREAQVVVMGKALTDVNAASYGGLKSTLLPTVLGALEDLRSRFDVVICEGAGGIAEINLRANDLVNLGLARAARLPVVLVGNIDLGGVFASLFGSLALLDPEDQATVQGFLINKFRGDVSLLMPGLVELERRTGRPMLGVLPWRDGPQLDEEDSLALAAPPGHAAPPTVSGGDWLTVAVVRFPRVSNFTDFDPVAIEPGVQVRFTQSPGDLLAADLVVLPGTKSTVSDLAWLRDLGLHAVLEERATLGRPILGICGGYQMLGGSLVDDVESRIGEVPGLGLLPVATTFLQEKVLARPHGVASGFDGAPVSGYEIHHGRVRRHGGEGLFSVSAGSDDGGSGGGEEEGCRLGAVLGTSWHGTFESDLFRRALLGWVAAVRGLRWSPGTRLFADVREERLDALGDLVAEHVDEGALLTLIEGRAPARPIVTTGLI